MEEKVAEPAQGAGAGGAADAAAPKQAKKRNANPGVRVVGACRAPDTRRLAARTRSCCDKLVLALMGGNAHAARSRARNARQAAGYTTT